MRDGAEPVPDAGVRQSLLEHPAWTRWGAHVGFWLMYLAIRTAAAGADFGVGESVHSFSRAGRSTRSTERFRDALSFRRWILIAWATFEATIPRNLTVRS